MDDLARRWRESDRRSRDRRAAKEDSAGSKRRPGARFVFVLVVLATLGAGVTVAVLRDPLSSAQPPASPGDGGGRLFADLELESGENRGGAAQREPKPRPLPTGEWIDDAWKYAGERGGLVSFAVIDSRGRLRGHDMERLYPGASVVKAMILAAELRRLAAEGAPIDDGTDALLSAMIRYSDNEAADAVYARVGDEGMHAVAERAGMTGFTIAGYWGNAQITAGDMARFFAELDDLVPREHVGYAQSLLASVIPSQSWGIPVAAGDEWAARFKGGWLPDKALVHQAAEVRERGGPRQISMAILTDEQPSHEYGVETVEGVAARLLGTN
jgi:Beta-lactamase enzyme family